MGFIYHLQIVVTGKYNNAADLHTLQITTAHTKSFQSAVTSCSPVMDLKNGECSASVFSVRSQLHRLSLLFTRSLTTDQHRVRVTLRLAVYRKSVRLGDKPLRLASSNFFHLNTCGLSPYLTSSRGHSPCLTSSLTRGWVCRIQLLLALASAVILRSRFSGIHDHIRDSPNLEG
jgi:hypothetical protein